MSNWQPVSTLISFFNKSDPSISFSEIKIPRVLTGLTWLRYMLVHMLWMEPLEQKWSQTKLQLKRRRVTLYSLRDCWWRPGGRKRGTASPWRSCCQDRRDISPHSGSVWDDPPVTEKLLLHRLWALRALTEHVFQGGAVRSVARCIWRVSLSKCCWWLKRSTAAERLGG